MPSIREIAKHANVSKSTVSLALNNKPGISAKMRDHVLTAAQELSSTEFDFPSRSESKSNGAKSLSVMVLHPPILDSSYVFSELLRGIEACATKLNIQLRLAINEPDLPQNHATRIYLSQEQLRPDGVLVIGARVLEPLVDEATAMGIPCMLAGRKSAETNISLIRRDEANIAYEMVSYLISLGHKSVAFLGGDPNYHFTIGRLHGYQNALKAHGITPKASWVVLGEGKSATETILASSPEITAAMYVNELHAMEGLPVFEQVNMAIPDDISIVCFDDTQEAKYFDPPLTTVRYHHFDEGFWMLKMLAEQIRYPLIKSTQVTFHGTLIKRESCKAPR